LYYHNSFYYKYCCTIKRVAVGAEVSHLPIPPVPLNL
jgi:hypothetical protein